MPDTPGVEIYRVGLLHDWQLFVHDPDRPFARRRFRNALGRPLANARRRNWGSVRSYFNGYLAEHPTDGTRAGHGWTRGRAARDLAQHLGCDVKELA